jgi:nucleoside phosphorylase
MTTLITIATEKEAHETLKSFDAQRLDPYSFSFHGGKIVITGMGSSSVAERLPLYLEGVKNVINIGVAGALQPTRSPFSIHRIASAHNEEGKEISLTNDGLRLLSVEKPLYTSVENFDLVDMEGYTVAQVSLRNALSCTLYKVVSDYCNKNSSEDIRKALPKAAFVIRDQLHWIISEIKNVTAVQDRT